MVHTNHVAAVFTLLRGFLLPLLYLLPVICAETLSGGNLTFGIKPRELVYFAAHASYVILQTICDKNFC